MSSVVTDFAATPDERVPMTILPPVGAPEEIAMNAESILAIVLAVALIVYLMYSLLRPERF